MSHLRISFLDKYMDASTMERMAMSSITEQLPRRAVSLTKRRSKVLQPPPPLPNGTRAVWTLRVPVYRVNKRPSRALSNRCSLAEFEPTPRLRVVKDSTESATGMADLANLSPTGRRHASLTTEDGKRW
jgi:hypothetical protein